MMSPPSPVSRCNQCNGHGWVGLVGGSINQQPLVVTTSSSGLAAGQLSHMMSSSSPPIRHSSRERPFARPAPPSTSGLQ